MAQISINVKSSSDITSSNWYEVNILDFSDNLSVTCHSTPLFCIYVWGDPAYRYQDKLIVSNVLTGCKRSYPGRSWLMINKETRVIYAVPDEFGAFPILIYQKQCHTVIASSRTSLSQCLNNEVNLKKSALREIMGLGQLFNSESIVENTHHYSESTLISVNLFKNNHTKQQLQPRYASYRCKHTRYKDAKEAFLESVRQSVTCANNPVISLSGGLDSRAILAACEALNLTPDGLCYGDPNSTDVEYAKKLASVTKLKLYNGLNKPVSLDKHTISRIALASGGEVPLHHAHALMDNTLLTQTKGRTIITGTGAETYRAFYYDRGMPGFSLFGIKSLNRFTLPRVKRYITEELTKQTAPLLPYLHQDSFFITTQINEFINQHYADNIDAATIADLFYLKMRCHRMVIAGQQLLDSYYNRTHPFLNEDVVRTMLNLPVKYKLHSNFHRKLIEDLSPKLAALPWDKTQKPLRHGLTLNQKYPGLCAKLGLKAQFAKASKPMYQYNLSNVSDSVLMNTIELLGLSVKDNAKLVSQINHYSLKNYILGFGLIWLNVLKIENAHS